MVQLALVLIHSENFSWELQRGEFWWVSLLPGGKHTEICGKPMGNPERNIIEEHDPHLWWGKPHLFARLQGFYHYCRKIPLFYLFGIARIYFNHILYIHIECGVCFDVVLSVLSHQRKGWGSARLCHRRNPAEGSIVLESCWMPRWADAVWCPSTASAQRAKMLWCASYSNIRGV